MPGTAKTSRPWSMASLAVMAEPLYCAPSTTSTPSAHAADDAVADGEILREGRGAHGEFGDDQPLGRHLGGQLAVLRRVHDIHAAAEHRDGIAAGGQRALVRRAYRCRAPCR